MSIGIKEQESEELIIDLTVKDSVKGKMGYTHILKKRVQQIGSILIFRPLSWHKSKKEAEHAKTKELAKYT